MKINALNRRHGVIFALTGLALGSLFTSPFAARAQTASVSRTNTNAPTFNKDIAPILYKNCASCHHAGEVAPFSLLTYQDARKRARQLAEVTHSRLMPPWRVDSHGEFQDERRLTDAQIATIKAWAEGGTTEGKPADLPPTPTFPDGWTLGKPDLLVQPSASYTVAAEGRDVYRCYVIPTHFAEDRFVSTIDVHPGSRAVVHHIIAYLDTTGQARKLADKEGKDDSGYTTFGGIGVTPAGMLGGWAPGATAHPLPADVGIKLPKGADIVLEVHYHKDGKSETDLSQVAVYFNKGVVDKEMHYLPFVNTWFNIPPGDKNYEAKVEVPIPVDATLLTVFPHMHLLGRTMQVTLTTPDGKTKSLVSVPDWNFNWQGFYAYKEPVKVPQGAILKLSAHYDNSTDNPRNPTNPPKAVRWGEQTTDEMCLCYLGFTVDSEHLAKGKKTALK